MGRREKGFHTPFAVLQTVKPAAPPAAKSLRAKPSAPAAPPPPKPQSDAELFLAEMAGLSPIQQKAPRVGAPPAAPARKPSKSDDAEVLASLADLCTGEGPFDIADTDEFVEGIAEGLDRRILKRLRHGEYAVQAHLDLHGRTREEARDAVARFMVESRRAGRRCVLIVHGRGMHSKDQIPVLKLAVRSWLERGQISRLVLAFTTARPHDGGAGAMYVLLRR
jgi:DNA-nicking Smr family endonuclease